MSITDTEKEHIMQKQFYFLSPVEVVKVTSSNLEEVAEWCGGRIAKTESRSRPGEMISYVWVPTPKGTKISWAFPGMFITKRVVVTEKGTLKCTWAVYRKDYFEKNYFDTPDAAIDATWAKKEPVKKPAEKPPVVVNQNFDGDQFQKAVENVKEAVIKLGDDLGIDLSDVAGKIVKEREENLDEKIDEVHGPGAAAAIEHLYNSPLGASFSEDSSVVQRREESQAEMQHTHARLEKCSDNNCTADRYAEGTHYFTDAVVVTNGEDKPNEVYPLDTGN